MKKFPLILASAVLLITTGAPSSSNPQQTAPNGLLHAPHAVPNSGGAPMHETPERVRRR